MENLKKHIIYYIFATLSFFFNSCEEKPKLPNSDFVTVNDIVISSDSVSFDTIPSIYLTPLKEIRLYNIKNSEPLKIKNIYLKNNKKSVFNININGLTTSSYNNISIGYGDSISIFINAFVKENPKDKIMHYTDSLIITGEDDTQAYITLEALCQDTRHIDAISYNTDTRIEDNVTILLKDSIVVENGVQLTISKGCKLWMDKDAYIRIKGSLNIEGTKEAPVKITSVRNDDIVPNVSYKNVPGQFRGIIFSGTSKDNHIKFLRMENGSFGLYFDDGGDKDNNINVLSLKNSRITNMTGEGLRLNKGIYNIYDSEISNTLGTTLYMKDGIYNIERSDIVNFYSWRGIRLAKALVYENEDYINENLSRLDIRHSVITGSHPLKKDNNGNYTSGEIIINTKGEAKQNIIISESFVSLPTINDSSIQLKDIIRPYGLKNGYDDIFSLLGIDKNGKMNYIYDFSPLRSAPFASKGKGETYVDINGDDRGTSWAYGAYVERVLKD